MNFNLVKAAVAKQWSLMQKHQLFTVDLDKDKLWEIYLGSFPPGTDPILRVRTEHTCSCCKNFIRTVGNVVAIIDDQMVSIWDVDCPEYQVIVDALSKHVKMFPISDQFYHYERTAGTDKNFQEVVGESQVKTWTHFFVNIDPKFVLKKDLIPTKLSEIRSTKDVYLRSLTEITEESITIVLDLINQGSLYRGEEHKGLIEAFKKAKQAYKMVSPVAKILLGWCPPSPAVARIKNTVIGTLLMDLSEGKEIDQAVGSYESKVAPTNYKRPTALITKGMIEKAKATLSELGLTSALERRYARLEDIKINDIIFANRSAKKVISNDPLDNILATAKVKVSDKVEEISIDEFINNIIPRVDSVEVLLENRMINSLVSLIAPVDATSLPLFKWSNRFSWSYNGDVTDSIKERVKKAGGNVEADLCCRLAWYNYDDLDLHLQAPDGHIYFGCKRVGHGCLDVDMNAGVGQTREAVENIFYANKSSMVEGMYTLFVKQYQQRESIDTGFEVEIDYLGESNTFTYDKAVKTRENITVCKFTYTRKGGLQITDSLPRGTKIKTLWGIQTGSFHQAKVILFSPNHWDGAAIGNKHYFFMLDGCVNDSSARGFYNEFLRGDLDKHRKVLEVVGSKLKTESSSEQLSGIGFSSTQRNSVVCRVKGSFTRTLKVQF